VQVGNVSTTHDFFHEAPAELGAGALADQIIRDWLAKKLVRPWSAGDSMQTLGTITAHPTQPLFIAAAAFLYLGILLSKHVYVFRNWLNKLNFERSFPLRRRRWARK